MPEIEGFILAGGASSRMGADKSRLTLKGLSFVEHMAAALRPLCARTSVVSSRHDASGFGLPVVPDIYESRGALGGLHAALTSCGASWAAVVSCDLPFVTAELLRRLASFRVGEVDAVAPHQADGRPQPLCALYAPETCLPVAEDLIRAGELRPRVLLERVRTRRVAFAELSDLAGARLFFANVNTPEDYEKAKSEVGTLNDEL